MKSFGSIIALFIAVISCDAGDIEVISQPSAGESNLAIVKDKREADNYFFMNTKTSERLGDVLPPDLEGARVNGIESSWSADGRKVAVFISYGTKLNTVFLYSLGDDHKMKLVEFPDVDPIKVYNERNPKKHFSSEAPGYEENAIGNWITNNTVRIVRGQAKEYEDETRNFLIVLEVKIADSRGQIVKLSPVGVLSDKQAEGFLKDWGGYK